jgi:hypothetical protein
VARALANALGLEFGHATGRDRVLDLGTSLGREATLAGTGPDEPSIDLVRATTMGHALAKALAAVQERRDPKHRRTTIQPLAETFAETLVSRAGIADGYRARVELDRLPGALEMACAAFAGRGEPESSWAATVSRRLAGVAAPVFRRDRSLAEVEPVIIRVPALALAAEADRRNRPAASNAFRTVAAGVTLLQRRAADPEALETVLLARA